MKQQNLYITNIQNQYIQSVAPIKTEQNFSCNDITLLEQCLALISSLRLDCKTYQNSEECNFYLLTFAYQCYIAKALLGRFFEILYHLLLQFLNLERISKYI